jgi:transposase
MRKTFKYRLYSNQDTLKRSEEWLNLCRFLYNCALEQRISAYKNNAIIPYQQGQLCRLLSKYLFNFSDRIIAWGQNSLVKFVISIFVQLNRLSITSGLLYSKALNALSSKYNSFIRLYGRKSVSINKIKQLYGLGDLFGLQWLALELVGLYLKLLHKVQLFTWDYSLRLDG